MPNLSPEPPHYHVVRREDKLFVILHEVTPGLWKELPRTYTRRQTALSRARNLWVDETVRAEAEATAGTGQQA